MTGNHLHKAGHYVRVLTVKRAYRHLFFDLDRTLWDFERNSADTLHEIFEDHGLEAAGVHSAAAFSETYARINNEMWEAYRKGAIDKSTLRGERFERTLAAFGIDNPELGSRIGEHYIHESPRKRRLLPGVHETLSALQEYFELHIITNGFEEVQQVKLAHSRLRTYFGKVVTSEAAGVKKPARGIFDYALTLTGAEPTTSLMIGDDVEVDVLGAKEVGIDQVYFNPEGLEHSHDVTYEVRELPHLVDLLM